MEKYAQWKILFWDTKWLLSNMPYRGRDDWAVWACAIARTPWPLQCELAPWKSNEALFIFCGQRVWNLLKSQKNEDSVWRQLFESGESLWMGGKISKWMTKHQWWDEHWRGRSVSVATEIAKQQIVQRIRDYRWVTIDEIAVEFSLSHSSAYSIVHDDLGYRKVCTDGS
jgi:hypothetical protein